MYFIHSLVNIRVDLDKIWIKDGFNTIRSAMFCVFTWKNIHQNWVWAKVVS